MRLTRGFRSKAKVRIIIDDLAIDIPYSPLWFLPMSTAYNELPSIPSNIDSDMPRKNREIFSH
jgi:hypothetical protein